MRVGYLTSQYPAASHTFVRREVEALRRRGIDIETFSVRRPEDEERVHPVDKHTFETTTYILPASIWRLFAAHLRWLFRRPGRYISTLITALTHRVPGVRAILWSLFYFGEAMLLAQDLDTKHVQHLHNHFANPAANVGLLACRLLNLSWSVTLHGTADLDYPSRLLIPKKVETARFIVCVSDYGRAQALRIVQPTLWNKFRVVRCGVSLAQYPERVPHAGRLRIVSVGRLSPEKGQLGLLEAFSGLVKRGLDVELRIIGDGPLHAELERRVQAEGIADRCVLVGRLSEPEVAVELASADVFALSSFMEGLPVALMEALAMRLGVIAPSVAGIPELVEHERTGLLFTAGRWDQLEEGLARLLSDPALRSRLGEAGRHRVEAEFEIDTAVAPLFEEFKKLEKEGNS